MKDILNITGQQELFLSRNYANNNADILNACQSNISGNQALFLSRGYANKSNNILNSNTDILNAVGEDIYNPYDEATQDRLYTAWKEGYNLRVFPYDVETDVKEYQAWQDGKAKRESINIEDLTKKGTTLLDFGKETVSTIKSIFGPSTTTTTDGNGYKAVLQEDNTKYWIIGGSVLLVLIVVIGVTMKKKK